MNDRIRVVSRWNMESVIAAAVRRGESVIAWVPNIAVAERQRSSLRDSLKVAVTRVGELEAVGGGRVWWRWDVASTSSSSRGRCVDLAVIDSEIDDVDRVVTIMIPVVMSALRAA